MAGNVGLTGMSGLDTAALVQALVAAEKGTSNRLSASRTKAVTAQAAWEAVASKIRSLGTASQDLATATRALPMKVASTNASAIAVSGTPTRAAQSTVTVEQLASAASWSVNGFGSGNSSVGAGRAGLAAGAGTLGIASMVGSAAGSLDVSVTQASASASVSSSIAVPLVVASPLSLDVTVNGPAGTATASATIAAGTYASLDAIAAAANSTLATAGARLVASGTTLRAETISEGSAHSIAVNGSAATAWGMPGAAASGIDAILVAGGSSTTLSSVTAGGQATVTAGTGTLSLTVSGSGGLRTGSTSVTTIQADAGAVLDDVAAALRASGLVTATVLAGPVDAQLLVASRATGTDAAVHLAWAGFDLGTATQRRAGVDALLTVDGVQVSRPSNTLTDILPGAQVSLVATTSSPVTVSSEQDADALVAKARAFVTAVNDATSLLDTVMLVNRDDPSKSGALAGDSMARAMRRTITASVTQVTTESTSYASLSSIGIAFNRTGTLALDEAALRKAVTAAPADVLALLSRGATTTDSRVSYVTAGTTAQAGTYAVSITRAAERATATGTAFATLSAAETITVTSGTRNAAFSAVTGMTPGQVAQGLSKAMRNAGIQAYAEATTAGQVRMSASDFGSSSSFTVASTGSGSGLGGLSAVGVDVAGTIAGQAASGSGRVLTATAGAASSLALSVAATAAQVSAAGGTLALGNVDFRIGAGGMVRSMADNAASAGGAVSNARDSVVARLRTIDAGIARESRRLADYESRVTLQYARLEAAIAKLQSSVPKFPAVPASS